MSLASDRRHGDSRHVSNYFRRADDLAVLASGLTADVKNVDRFQLHR